jgi:hypothetical protein
MPHRRANENSGGTQSSLVWSNVEFHENAFDCGLIEGIDSLHRTCNFVVNAQNDPLDRHAAKSQASTIAP